LSQKKLTILSRTTIGLLGGSFDPPHKGHVHITNQALKAFGLNKIWWLVSPRNPLKSENPASIAKRIMECKKIINHPKVLVSDIETRLKTRFTADTLKKLYQLYPNIRFIWLMGADNLGNFHQWEDWTWIMENIPVGIMARPGEQVKAGLSLAATRYKKFRIHASTAASLPFRHAPAWSLLGGPMRAVSSTQIRSRGLWNQEC